MNGNEKLNSAFANVDDKYIMSAMQPPKRNLRTWQRVALVAACLALVIGAYFPIRNAIIMGRYAFGVTFVDTEQGDSWFNFGAQSPEEAPLPWDDTLYLKGDLKKRSFAPGESVELYLELGLKDDYLGAGDLQLSVNVKDFTVQFEGYDFAGNTLIVEDFELQNYTKEQPLTLKIVLTPDFAKAWAMGEIGISLHFAFDDVQDFYDKVAQTDVPHYNESWQTVWFENDALILDGTRLNYAADMVEMRVDSAWRGAVDTWEIMIAEHYKMRKITARQFADMYYGWAYDDNIYASVDSYMTEEHTVRFSYLSKNIRYECNEYIDAPEMWALYEKVQAFEMADWDEYNSSEAHAARRALAEYILLYMKEHGIITAEEYESEAAWMAEAGHVGNAQTGYDQNVAPYSRVLQKYMYTH